MHEGARISPLDGFVEVEIEGNTIRVPGDDIVMAARRSSLELKRDNLGLGS